MKFPNEEFAIEKYSYSIRTYFKSSRLFLSASGIWPYQSINLVKIIRLIWILQHISIFVPEVIKLYESRNNVDLVIESIPSVFYNIVLAIMFGNSIYHQKKIRGFLEKINRDWESLNDKKEIEVLTRYADIGKIMSWIYIGSIYFTLVSFCLIPLVPVILDYVQPLNESRPKAPLYRVQLYIDDEKYFYSILMHAYTTSTIGIIPLVAVDIFFANCIQHVCGMLTILGNRLENTSQTKTKGGELDNKLYETIVDCTSLHGRILELSLIQDINYMFSTAFGILLLILVSLMSMTGLVVLIKWGNLKEVIRFGLFTSAELFHLFCYSYHSQDLINHNNKLYNSICNSGWYKSSIRTRTIIQIMFLRCLKPCLMKCLIYPLTMENFTTLMKTSFSYFTVIKSCRY